MMSNGQQMNTTETALIEEAKRYCNKSLHPFNDSRDLITRLADYIDRITEAAKARPPETGIETRLDREWINGAQAGYRVGYNQASGPEGADNEALTRLIKPRLDNIYAAKEATTPRLQLTVEEIADALEQINQARKLLTGRQNDDPDGWFGRAFAANRLIIRALAILNRITEAAPGEREEVKIYRAALQEIGRLSPDDFDDKTGSWAKKFAKIARDALLRFPPPFHEEDE